MGGSREPIEPSQHWQVLRSADPVLASTVPKPETEFHL
jgi:hypothetical protein